MISASHNPYYDNGIKIFSSDGYKLPDAIEEEIERLLRQLSEYLLGQISGFESSQKMLLNADMRFAQGQLASAMQASPCSFDEDEVSIMDLKHPLLLLANVDVIPNSVHLNKARRILLLSGPKNEIPKPIARQTGCSL